MGAYEFNPATPPTPCIYITCPANILAIASPGQNSAVVNYPAPTGAPVATLSSSPPSGSVFPGGTNIVTCNANATDSLQTYTFAPNFHAPRIAQSAIGFDEQLGKLDTNVKGRMPPVNQLLQRLKLEPIKAEPLKPEPPKAPSPQ